MESKFTLVGDLVRDFASVTLEQDTKCDNKRTLRCCFCVR